MKEEKHIDQLFSGELANIEFDPSPAVWDNISDSLKKKHNRKLAMLILPLAAAFAMIIALSYTAYVVLNKNAQPPLSQKNKGIQHEVKINHAINNVAISKPHGNKLSQSINKSKEQEKPSIIEPNAYADTNRKQESIAKNNKVISAAVFQGLQYIQAMGIVSIATKDNSTVEHVIQQHYIDGLSAKAEGTVVAEEPSVKNVWVFGAQVAPTYTFRFAKQNNSINVNEKGLRSFSGAVTVAMQHGKRWAFESGIYYNRYGQNLTPRPSTVDADKLNMVAASVPTLYKLNTSAGNLQGLAYVQQTSVGSLSYDNVYVEATDQLEGVSFEQIFDMIGVPLRVKYNLIDRKVNLQMIGGIEGSFLIGNRSYQNISGSKYQIEGTSNLNKFNCTALCGISLGYRLISNINFFIEPSFRYQVNSLNKLSEYDYHPYSIGIYSGLGVRF